MPWWAALLVGLVVVGSCIPVLRWLRPAVEALLYSHPADAQALVRQVGRESASGSDHFAIEIAAGIAGRLRLPYVAISTGEAEPDLPGDLPASRSGLVRIPLAFSGEPVGSLLVLPRERERGLSAQDARLLEEIALHLGTALHAVTTSADLRRSRAALVTAREEERRRIRRDLHDGLGPALASLRMHLAAAEQLLPGRPEEARELVGRLRADLRDTSAGVRELVYGLRPTMLDEYGLGRSLQARADDLAAGAGAVEKVAVTLDLPDPLPELPAAHEVALYRIASEALANVGRHARATTCRVSLFTEDGPGGGSDVVLVVEDDGHGLPVGLVEGVGLMSMRERAAELGGRLDVGPGTCGGTRIVGRLPRGSGLGPAVRITADEIADEIAAEELA